MAVTVTKFPRQDLAAAFRKLAPTVAGLPPIVSAANLLWALSGNESSYGADCTPRHEPAYDAGGRYASAPEQAALLAKFGHAAACSYGPLQVMLCNAPAGASPDDFNDLETAVSHSIFALNNQLARFKPQRVAEIGYCWNGGHIANPVPAAKDYGTRLAARYLMPMPAAE